MVYLNVEHDVFGLSFAVQEGVFVSRPESESLVELALARVAPPGTAALRTAHQLTRVPVAWFRTTHFRVETKGDRAVRVFDV